jgi:hypothetical protein
MSTGEIERSEWEKFFASFSNARAGWLTRRTTRD